MSLLPYLILFMATVGPATLLFPRSAVLKYSLLPLIPVMLLSQVNQKVRYYLRLSTYITALAITSIWGATLSIFMAIIGQGANVNYVVARSFLNFCGPLVGIKVTVEGQEHLDSRNGPAVIIGNHQSLIDILYLGAIFPKNATIMAKKELRWAPFLGAFLSFSKAVFVDRMNRKDAVATFAKAADSMKKKGVSLFIFPEGTRYNSRDPTLLPFKKGAFHLAVQAQIPLVPVVCGNYHNIYASGKHFEQGHMIIKVLPPVPTTGLTSASEDINKLVDQVRTSMLDALEELAARPNSSAGSSNVIRDGALALEAKKGKKQK